MSWNAATGPRRRLAGVAGRAALMILLAVFSAPAFANRLLIDSARITLDESVEITLILDGSFAEVDSIDLPLQNLELEGTPSVSTEFRWMNGVSSRRKVLRYRAHAEREGEAVAGPLVLRDGSGVETTIEAVSVQVAADPLASARDAESIARALERERKEAIFLIAEADRDSVYVGDQVIVTWFLYTAEPVRDFSLIAKPEMEGFWVEEIPVTDEPLHAREVAGRRYQVVPVRRVALFPVRSGALYVSPFEALAQIIRPIRNPRGGISFFEGQVENVRRRSPSLRVEALPLPATGPSQAVGTYTMRCTVPRASAAGPVALEVTIRGSGNLRAARPPAFVRAPRGEVNVEDRGVKVTRSEKGVVMERTWRFVILPTAAGRFEVPPLAFVAFEPQSRTNRRQECGGAVVTVARVPAAAPQAAAGRPAAVPEEASRLPLFAAAGVVALLAFAWIVHHRRRQRSAWRLAGRLSAIEDPVEIRSELEVIVRSEGTSAETLRNAPTAAGDAWRAVESWLTIRHREPLTATGGEDELRLRIADLLRELRSARRGR